MIRVVFYQPKYSRICFFEVIILFKKKNKEELKKTPFVIISKEIEKVSEQVDKIVKNIISSRSSFYIEEVNIQFCKDPFVTLKCVYLEKNWSIEELKELDTYSTEKFDFDFYFDFFDFDDLPNMIFTKIEALKFA